MAQSITKIKLPVSLFGNIKSEEEPDGDQLIDLKKILLPVTGFVRIYSIKHGIKETNTPERINRLTELEIISKSQREELMFSYNFLMMQRFRVQTAQVLSNNQPNNRLAMGCLTEIEISTLKRFFLR